MFEKVLPKKTQEDLAVLRKAKVLEDFYLAGGTGLALQLFHRASLDFDFFTQKSFDSKILVQKIKNLGKFSIEKEAENTLSGIFNDTRITFLKYTYPLLFSLKKIQGIRVARIEDIGCMKISAISSRGTKKDFIDLYFICQKVPLQKLLKLFQKKYKSVDYNMVHILKSLVYFEDAKKDPLPKMIIPISWLKVKNFFQKEVKKIVF